MAQGHWRKRGVRGWAGSHCLTYDKRLQVFGWDFDAGNIACD